MKSFFFEKKTISMKKFGFEILLVLIVLCSLPACNGLKPASGGGGGLVQVFIKGKDSLLCHAGPIPYQALARGDIFEIDHTYMKVNNHRNKVVCNFSVYTPDADFRPSSVTVVLKNRTIEADSLTKFFAEGFGKRNYHYRYSFAVSDVDFNDWMLEKQPTIQVGGKQFRGGRRYRKDAEQVYRRILFDAF